MGWFSSKERKVLPWVQLTSIDQMEKAIEESKEKPVLFFKHSTRCSISSMALNNFESNWDGSEEDITIYFLDLLSHRDISNAMAQQTTVTHQSPQVIVLNNKEVVYTATHSAINAISALGSIQS